MISFQNIHKTFEKKIVFQDISVNINHKEFVCLMGPSGVGKSTFFDLLIGKEKTDSGNLYIDNINIHQLSPNKLQHYRRKLGIIFQDFKLLSKKTVFENLSFILEVCDNETSFIFSEVQKVLQVVGLEEKIAQFPHQLSGGEVQRIAIARALIHKPRIILADEPTGNLDPHNTKIILDILKKINKEMGVTIILATHDPKVISYLNTRVIYFKDKGILFDGDMKDLSID
jgi:cell division transport system ATP-binding protein